jgi:hypothetical protein
MQSVIKKYCQYEAVAKEGVISKAGYPNDKWDVSQLVDFSYTFWDHLNSMNLLGHGI